MQIHEKLRVMRQWKGWTQEALAEKLGCAVNTYAKIERGETAIKLDKLEKIAHAIGVDTQELIDTNDKTVFNFAENCTHSNLAHTILLTEAQCVQELEKAHLIIDHQSKEIDWLKEEISRLKEIIDLLKRAKTAI
ncbi:MULTISPECIES: helix-turn-helix domain-containing protein [Methylomicrobium]|uniref:Putative transcription factor, MBF1 like protein n=1 Tax=Methylomicrobium album BG8 TaxID=686340 RepID=H8GL69_METAL|nr:MULTISPECIES: helix-turn-helix domain-containing protein [Methylomicrobium]EIC28068.1 putative transcription factor, MBF1 like protein [Methylomicrobium album BG8]